MHNTIYDIHVYREWLSIGDKLFSYGDFFSKNIILGRQEGQYPQFLLQLPLTRYI